MIISNTKWLSLAVGGLAASAALGLPERIMTREVGNPLFLFAIMMLIDGAIAFKVIRYATINGPDERREELERRFYGWPRTRPRYTYIVVTSLVALLAVKSVGVGDLYLYGMIVVVAGYSVFAMIQVFTCRKQASVLYPHDSR